MSDLKLYYIRVIRTDDSDPTDHAYFEGDNFYVDKVRGLEIYDPETCVLRVFTSISKNGTARWSRK